MPLSPAVELVSTIAPPRPCSTSLGTATSTVFQTPVRLTSTTSRQDAIRSSFSAPIGAMPALASTMSTPPSCATQDAIRSSFSAPIGAMPALASTMSTPPSCATPSSRTALSAAWSRTSACLATIRRSSASTSLTVSARSSGVAIGYSTVGICSHRSTAMMSAPSWASRIAWLRPWPRAAPVTKATFPSTRPICSLPP